MRRERGELGQERGAVTESAEASVCSGSVTITEQTSTLGGTKCLFCAGLKASRCSAGVSSSARSRNNVCFAMGDILLASLPAHFPIPQAPERRNLCHFEFSRDLLSRSALKRRDQRNPRGQSGTPS